MKEIRLKFGHLARLSIQQHPIQGHLCSQRPSGLIHIKRQSMILLMVTLLGTDGNFIGEMGLIMTSRVTLYIGCC